MKAEEYWKQKYGEAAELEQYRWDDIVKFNVETMESWGRLQIEKDREKIKLKARKSDRFNDFVYVLDIDQTPIELD